MCLLRHSNSSCGTCFRPVFGQLPVSGFFGPDLVGLMDGMYVAFFDKQCARLSLGEHVLANYEVML